MQNCILIRDPHENENIMGVILTELSYNEVAKIADQCRGEDDESNDYDLFEEKLTEKGNTKIIWGCFDDIIF